MIYKKYIPQEPLNRYIESICYVEGNTKGVGLPKMVMSLVFNLDDAFKLYSNLEFTSYVDYKRHWVAGLQLQPSHVESYGSSRMIVTQFQPLGAFIFLDDPLYYYTDDYVSLDCIFASKADEVWERLHEADSISEQFLIVENFLYQKILSTKAINKKLIATIELLTGEQRGTSISTICESLNISRKHLNSLSKQFIGVSPKAFSSLSRLQRTLQSISSTPKEKLTDLAYEHAYFDQSHFINDFKKFTGMKPTDYARLVSLEDSLRVVPHFIPFRQR